MDYTVYGPGAQASVVMEPIQGYIGAVFIRTKYCP